MNPIYKPKGAAAEYGEYALNIYTGCPHNCFYCYSPAVLRKTREEFHINCEPRKNIIESTKKQLDKWQTSGITEKRIHLCFSCDPFPKGYDHTPTIEIIKAIKESGNHVQILTKNFEVIEEHPILIHLLDENDKFGITYDGGNGIYYSEQICFDKAEKILRTVFDMDCFSWVSFEPIINDRNVISFIKHFSHIIDEAKIGKLNYYPSNIDWKEFAKGVVKVCEENNVNYYIKDSLKQYI